MELKTHLHFTLLSLLHGSLIFSLTALPLAGSTCFPPHCDMRCAISLMQITGIPPYKCPFCACLIHKEMEKYLSKMSCPYCDVPLQKNTSILDESSEVVSEQINEIKTGVCEDCFDDCTTETVNVKDVPDDPCSSFLETVSYCVKKCPKWDELSVSDLSSDDETDDVDALKEFFDKELKFVKGCQTPTCEET